MNTTSSNKNWLWVLIIIVVAGLGYYYFYNNSTPAPTLTTTGMDSSVGAQVLGLLNQIQSLHIDSSIFNDPGYKTLRDFSVAIPSVNVGRPNPFAPLPGMSSTNISASVTVKTTK